MIELKPAINEVKLTLKSISSPINLGTMVEPVSGGSVPTDVRQAIYTLLENAAYATTGLEDEIAIVQAWAQEVTALSLSATSLTLNNDTPQTLTATVVPAGSTVIWSSSDESVATVVAGVVTGVGNGSCVITATAGGKSANCAVTVSGFATLESISAVYTQSGTVYDIYSLDSLKADLVVTATYSDTSTATVPSDSYLLSGTLTAGTSTITVIYHGKTTTFTVEVTDITTLPVGYTKYDYIYNPSPSAQSEANRAQMIDTGLGGSYCGARYDHEITFMAKGNASATDFTIYGCREKSGSYAKARVLWENYASSHNQLIMDYGGTETSAYIFSVDQKYKVVTADGKWIINDTVIASNMIQPSYAPYTGGNIWIYGISTGGNRASATPNVVRVYGFSVWDSETDEYIAYMIPALNSNNVAGLYDTVRGEFYSAYTENKLSVGNDE